MYKTEKEKSMRKISALILLPFACSSYGFGDFKCTIKDAVKLEDKGTLIHEAKLESWYLGKEFVVNRETGLISGAGLTNTKPGQTPQVYDYLPNQNSYRSVTHYNSNHQIDYLEIKQFVSNSDKPFVYIDPYGSILSGTCVAY